MLNSLPSKTMKINSDVNRHGASRSFVSFPFFFSARRRLLHTHAEMHIFIQMNALSTTAPAQSSAFGLFSSTTKIIFDVDRVV